MQPHLLWDSLSHRMHSKLLATTWQLCCDSEPQSYLQTSLWHVVMPCNIGMHWVSCCKGRHTTVLSSDSLWKQSNLAKHADEGLESLFPLWHFQQKHSIACMQAAWSRQVATTCLAHTLQQVCTWWDGFRQALATWCSALSQPRAQNLLQCLQVTIQGCWARG